MALPPVPLAHPIRRPAPSGMLSTAAICAIDVLAYGCHSDGLDLRGCREALAVRCAPTLSHPSHCVQREQESSLVTGEYRRAFASLQSLLIQYSPAELMARLARRHGATAHKI